MNQIDFSTIKSAKDNNIAAAEEIKKHFEGYIISKCLRSGEDKDGKPVTIVDEDARYFAETALLAAIFTFQFRDPPDDYAP